MKKLVAVFSLLLQIFALQAQNVSIQKNKLFKLPDGISAKDYIPGVILVKFKTDINTSAKTLSVKQLPTVKSTAVISIQKKFPQSESEIKTFSRANKDVGLSRIFEVKISNSSSIEQVINELLSDPNIEYAEPSYIHHNNFIPNDPRYVSGEQTYLDVVRAPQAWNLVQNSSGVIIGIVDSGSEITHPDLAANIYYNTADPVNGVDDDGDGFTDNYAGWDLVGASGSSIVPDNNPNVVGPSNDHGVHVSGIASAVTNNNTGVASIAFNAKLLIVKAGPDDNGSDILRGYEGIKYAADKGAQIIICSWGSSAGSSFGRDVIDYAISKGCLVVAAAGNTGSDIPEYPAAYRGVLAIANSRNDDVKASSSSYGEHVALSAPGNSILSTTFNKTYGLSSGTSMATPVVSSAAALVKSHFPLLNMQQVGELIRITADNIDDKNPDYVGKVGKGRLNVYRALTENPPSVRIQNISQEEHKASNVLLPDTLILYFDIKNFLFPVSNLKLTLSTLNSNATVLLSEVTIASIGKLETKQLVGPFKVAIKPETPSNTTVSFRLDYAANSYQDFENFSVIVAKDFLDINTPSISTTITSNGRVGFSSTSEENGAGFSYKGDQLLYEASLMIGNSSTRVSNNARSVSDQSDEHFIKVVRAHELANTSDSIKAESVFDDSGNPDRLNISVKQQMTVYKASPNDKYAIVEYEISNITNSVLRNVYAGLFTDFDIGSGSTNITQYDVSNRIGYVYDKQQSGSPYAAVKLLVQNVPPVYYPLSYNLSGNPLSDDDFTISEKWETLSNGVKALSLGTNTSSGVDVSFVSGNGPYDIPANSSIKIAFAIIGGDNLQDIQASAQAAQLKYNLFSMQPSEGPVTALEIQAYPNPITTALNSISTIRFTLPEEGLVSLDLYNVVGQKVKSLISNESYSKGVHYLNYNFSGGSFEDVNTGIYFYRLTCNNKIKTSKISVLR